jgi:hypothetical protein
MQQSSGRLRHRIAVADGVFFRFLLGLGAAYLWIFEGKKKIDVYSWKANAINYPQTPKKDGTSQSHYFNVELCFSIVFGG